MKQVFVFLFLSFALNCFAQSDTITVNGHRFIFKLEKQNEDWETTFVNVFRIRNGETKYLLKHIMDCEIGDCNSLSVEMGDYIVSDSSIVFYSFWCWQGDAPVSPWGARIQTYHVKGNGNVLRTKSKLYLESGREGFRENTGVQFLTQPPKSKNEKEAFSSYVRRIEKEYNADFVLKKEATELLKEVKTKFKKRISTLEKRWKQIDNSFGYKI